MKEIKGFNIADIKISDIVFVATSDPDYQMSRTMLVENYSWRSNIEAPQNHDWIIVRGSHCSCYGFDETEWEATAYTKEELIKLVRGWKEHGCDEELIIAPLIERYIS